MGAVEEYLSAFQTGLSQPGDVLNVPVTLLDDAWVASHRICADAALVGCGDGADVECQFALEPVFDFISPLPIILSADCAFSVLLGVFSVCN